MATAGSLEDHLTCSICLEIYKRPQILRCLHTYCTECIQQIQQKDRVQCPDCRKYTSNKEIQPDFKTQSLIDLFLQQTKSKTSTAEKHHCSICQKPDAKVISECKDCSKYMCSACDYNHREVEGKRYHNIVPYSDDSKDLHRELVKIKQKFENTKLEISSKARGVDQAVSDILSNQAEQFHKAQELKQELVQAIESHHDKIVATIKSGNDEQIEILRLGKLICDEKELLVQTKIDFIDDILGSKDISTLADTVNSLEADARVEISEIKSQLASISSQAKNHPVSIQKGNAFNPEKFMFISDVNAVARMQSSTDSTHSQSPLSLNSLIDSIYTQELFQKMENRGNTFPQRLSMIGGKLWCAKNSKGLYVFDQNCKLEKKVTHEMMKKVRGVTSNEIGDIFVACDDNFGLHHLDSSGRYLGQVIPGSFSDVCTFKDTVYALDYHSCRLIALSQPHDTWFQNIITLNYRNSHFCDKCVINSEGIYITAWESHCLYVYSLQGKYQYQRGRYGSTGVGQFIAPFLCDVDYLGNALVCDLAHHCLQVFNHSRDTWSIVQIQGEFQNARDVVVNAQRTILWIVTNGGIAKFKKV